MTAVPYLKIYVKTIVTGIHDSTKLEILQIGGGGGFQYELGRLDSKKKETTRWLLKNAPNVKKVFIENVSCLRLVPEDILAQVELADDFEFSNGIALYGNRMFPCFNVTVGECSGL